MTPVLDRSALEQSPLADLHLIANELGVDGFRRMRKADLVDAILAKQGGEDAVAAAVEADAETDEEPRRARRGRRGGRSRSRDRDEDVEEGATDECAGDEEPPAPKRGRSRARNGAGAAAATAPADDEDRSVEGEVELLGNESGFVRLVSGETSDDDVYISAA